MSATSQSNNRYLSTGGTARWLSLVITVLLPLAVSQVAYCDSFTIDFETLPALPVQPDNFAAAGPEQTYSQAGVFTIQGGVVLGNPTFLPDFATNGTVPNLYGTADFGDSSLSSTIRLDLPTTAFQFTSINFSLFNGEPFVENYMIFGMVGGIGLDPLPIGPLAPRGFTSVSLTSPFPITTLNITTPNAHVHGWDFFVDTIVLSGTAVTTVPEPSTFILLLAPVVGLGLTRYRRKQ